MENDKKYSITMGIMVFFFVVVIAIALAWGLGYIELGKKNMEKGQEEVENAQQVDDKEDVKEEELNLEEVYVKYDFDWVSKSKNPVTYVENGNIKIELGEKTYEVNFEYGTPVLVGDVPGHDFVGVVVLNDKGEVYKSSEAEYDTNGNLKSGNFTFTKLNINEEVIDISKNGGLGAVPYSGPYYMTKIGKVINGENKTYEDINKDHISIFGGLDYLTYICEDKTIEVERVVGDYIKIVDENGKDIKVKYMFDPNNSYEYKIIDEDDNYYSLSFNTNGVAYSEDKKVKEFSYDGKKYVANVTFTDGNVQEYKNVYSAYDVVNNKDM